MTNDPRALLAAAQERAAAAIEQWQAGRGTFNASHFGASIDDVLNGDTPTAVAALIAVLNLHHDGHHDECDYQELAHRPQRCHYCGELYPCATVRAMAARLWGIDA